MIFIVYSMEITLSERDKKTIEARHAAIGNPSPFSFKKQPIPEDQELPASLFNQKLRQGENIEDLLRKAKKACDEANRLKEKEKEIRQQRPDELRQIKKDFIENVQRFLVLKPTPEISEFSSLEGGMMALEKNFERWDHFYRHISLHFHSDKLCYESIDIQMAGRQCFDSLTELINALKKRK